MLFANSVYDAASYGCGWMVFFIAMAMILSKKFFNANPDVKDAAKKAAAAKAIQIIGRFFK
jgi:hypothetical protein